jgi:hypothetical protein
LSEGQRRIGRAIDTAIVAGIVVFALATASTLVDRSRLRSERERVLRDARELYEAMQLYRERHGCYPPAHGEDGFDPTSLEPLRRRGYYTGRLLERADRGRLDGYEGQGGDEYWLELTVASQPSTRILIARSDDAPLGGGAWLEGVYLYEDQQLVQR